MRAHEFINELKFFGSQCTKDCSGHRAGYAWYKKKQRLPQKTHPSFMKGSNIAQQQQAAGIDTISGGITNAKGRFQAFQPGRTD